MEANQSTCAYRQSIAYLLLEVANSIGISIRQQMQYAVTNTVILQVVHHVSSISLEHAMQCNVSGWSWARMHIIYAHTLTCSFEVTAQKTISAKF